MLRLPDPSSGLPVLVLQVQPLDAQLVPFQGHVERRAAVVGPRVGERERTLLDVDGPLNPGSGGGPAQVNIGAQQSADRLEGCGHGLEHGQIDAVGLEVEIDRVVGGRALADVPTSPLTVSCAPGACSSVASTPTRPRS